MTNYTLGTGGDYADVGALFSYFAQHYNTFTDGIHVSLLNDIYNNNSILDVNSNPYGGSFFLNGHNFTFNLNGHRIIFNAIIGLNFSYDYDNGAGTLEIYGGIMQGATDGYTPIFSIYYGSRYSGLPEYNQVIKIHDIVFVAKSVLSVTTMLTMFQSSGWSYCQISNCRFYVGKGFGLYLTGNSGGPDPDASKFYKILENNSVYSLDAAIGFYASFATTYANLVCKNTVVCRNPVGPQSGYPSFYYTNNAGIQFINCADSDGSLNGQDTGSVHGITDADFISVDPSGVFHSTGQWDFEGNLNDAIGGNTATVTGPGSGSVAYVSGVSGGQAVDISGLVNKYLVFPYNSLQTLTPTNHWEAEFYIYYVGSGIIFSAFSVSSGMDWIYLDYSYGVISIWNASPGNRIPYYTTFGVNNWYKIKLQCITGDWRLWVNDVELSPLYTSALTPKVDQYYYEIRSDDQIKIYDSLKIGTNNSQPEKFLWIDDTSKLYQTGTTAISDWNQDDIVGNPRPDAAGKVSIGIYEPVVVVSQRTETYFQVY